MPNSYDLVRYPGVPFPQTHPDRLAAMATFFGLTPPSIHQARVLEIGCCDGGNLIPMAINLPGSEFVGIDLTESDILAANETVAALKLPNIHFHVLDLTALPGELGQFDYIIAHGVYSWVPPDVRDALLTVIKASLTPHGVAFVSYNTYPGGHARNLMRDMMLFHSRGFHDPRDILTRSREMVSLVASVSTGDEIYHPYVAGEAEVVLNCSDAGLFHDELEENYQAVYFHEFAAHAGRNGLQYISEANYSDTQRPGRSAAEAAFFEQLGGDRLVREQYQDFVRIRHFRQSLLCHSGIPLDGEVHLDRLMSLFVSTPFRMVSFDGTQAEFHGPNKAAFKSSHPIVCRVMHALGDVRPRALAFADLPRAKSDPDEVCDLIHTFLASGLVEIRMASPNLSTRPGERPLASPLARLQAPRSKSLTALHHIAIDVSGGFENRLIELLDGTRTRADLLAEFPGQEAEIEKSLIAFGQLGLLVS